MTIPKTCCIGAEILSDTLNRLHKISGYAAVATKIIMVALVIVIISAAVMLAMVSAGSFDLIIEELAEEEVTTKQIQAAALNAIAASAAVLVILYHIDRLFTNIHKRNALFTDDNVRDLRIIALLLAVAAVIITTVSVITIYFLLDTTDIVVGFNPLTMLLAAFIVYIMSLIFSHGTELQRQSDETL